jgi:ApaG protein
MQVAETFGIIVSVDTEYVGLQSNPIHGEYFFAYRINIRNSSNTDVQLLRRKWFIADATYEIREVEGEGVVGEQPVIEQGESHAYMSGCQLHSEIGEMWGYYTLEKQITGELIEVTIPKFELIVPWLKN